MAGTSTLVKDRFENQSRHRRQALTKIDVGWASTSPAIPPDDLPGRRFSSDNERGDRIRHGDGHRREVLLHHARRNLELRDDGSLVSTIDARHTAAKQLGGAERREDDELKSADV